MNSRVKNTTFNGSATPQYPEMRFSKYFQNMGRGINCGSMSPSTIAEYEELLSGRMTVWTIAVLTAVAAVSAWANAGVLWRTLKVVSRRADTKPAFYFIGNLAASDFLIAFIVIGLFAVDLINFSTAWRKKYCGVITTIVVTACQETICSIALIAVDKYIYICHGINYTSIVTQRRVNISIAITWVFSLVIGILPVAFLHDDFECICNYILYVNKSFSIIFFLTSVALPFTLITTLYSVILSLALRIRRQKLGRQLKRKSITSKSQVQLESTFQRNQNTNASLGAKSLKTESSCVSPTIEYKKGYIECSLKNEVQVVEINSENDESQRFLPDSIVNKEPAYSTLSNNQENNLSSEDDQPSSALSHEQRLGHSELNSIPHKQEDEKHISKDDNINMEIDSFSLLLTNKQFNSAEKISKLDIPEENISKDQEIQKFNRKNETELCDHVEFIPGPANINNKQPFNIRNQLSQVKNYYRRVSTNTRDKVRFLRECKAVKTVVLILFCFFITYVPFVTGTMVFKLQQVKNYNLFKSLNNLLHIAVILNSLLNPFVYAYGYKEFRLRTKKYKFNICNFLRRKT